MLFITGDTHGGINEAKLYARYFPKYKECTKEDYVIIAGDFGYVWDNSSKEVHLREVLNKKKFTTLFIDGNHENFDLLETYPIIDKFGGKVRQIDTSIFQLLRGEVYNIGGKTIFTFGGASSVDKVYRQEGISWWSSELPNNKEIENALNNLEKVNYKVDIVVTHTCPSNLLPYVLDGENRYGEDICNKFFEEIQSKLDYDFWYFGHFHKDLKIGKDIAIFNEVVVIE